MENQNSYRNDILEQPVAIRRAARSLVQHPDLRTQISSALSKPIDRIVLTGMGSSYYAPYPLHLRLTSALQNNWCIETSELLHYSPELLAKNTLVIAVSQSGRSAELVRLAERCSADVALIAVTNEIGSPLAQAATATIDINAGTEATVSSKTYLASLAALSWLGDLLVPDGESWFQHTEQGCDVLDAYLGSAEAYIDEIAEVLRGVKNLFLTGRGYSLATCGTGALIMKESTRTPAEGLSSAAFRHGPFEMVSQESVVLVFEGDERTSPLNMKLAKDVAEAGGRSALIGPNADRDCFRLPLVSAPILPMTEILPVQLATLALAKLGGFEAGVFKFGSKVTTQE